MISCQHEVLQDDSDKPVPVMLAFDEMTLHKDMQFDQGEERVYGPNGNAQVAMVRGIFKNFVQPIFYDFDKAMTKSLLFSILERLDAIGLRTQGMVSDLGATNQALWRELGIQPGSNSFTFKERKVFVFADIPHMLKLLRNHLLDTGLVFPTGTRFQKDDILRLLHDDCSELRLNHKLTELHFNCHHSQRQNVSLAAQLLSHRTASAYRFLYGKNSPEEEERASMIDLVNNAFDVMNSRSKEGHKEWDYALGWLKVTGTTERGFLRQKDILFHMRHFINNMRVLARNKDGEKVPRKTPLPFQRGWVVSIDSALELLSQLQEEYGATYLMTSRCNSDNVENFFSRIRYIAGADTHPASVDFKNRFRLVVLGQSADYIVQNASVKFQEEEEPILLSQQLVEGVGFEAEANTGFDVVQEDSNNNVQDTEAMEDDEDLVLQTVVEVDIPLGGPLAEKQQLCAEEALKFIAGYIAFKKKKEYPDLGSYAYTADSVSCPWIDTVSYGGLTRPTQEWYNQVACFEQEFQKIHGAGIKREANIISSLHRHLCDKFPEVPEKLVKFYAKMRIHFRLKYLRRQFKKSSEEKRNAKKAKHFAT